MNKIEEILNSHGIKSWGLVKDPDAKTYEEYRKWISEGKHGVLGYLADERADTRESITKYFPEFQSALVFTFDYSRTAKIAKKFYESEQSNGLKVANYVYGFEGLDYHFVLKDKLNAISDDLRELFPNAVIKQSLDTQPILERDLAMKAGIGWFGKNSMLINKDIGSYFLLGSLFFDIDLSEYDLNVAPAVVDHCGSCTKCIVACPTDAIDLNSRTLVADKCISTFTIELFKDAKAPVGMEKGSGEIYGCDICQDVCPWNMRVERRSDDVSSEELDKFREENYQLIKFFLVLPVKKILSNLEELSNRGFRKLFHGSPFSRTGRIGLMKNLNFYKKD